MNQDFSALIRELPTRHLSVSGRAKKITSQRANPSNAVSRSVCINHNVLRALTYPRIRRSISNSLQPEHLRLQVRELVPAVGREESRTWLFHGLLAQSSSRCVSIRTLGSADEHLTSATVPAPIDTTAAEPKACITRKKTSAPKLAGIAAIKMLDAMYTAREMMYSGRRPL
jgi:hypothetical protein